MLFFQTASFAKPHDLCFGWVELEPKTEKNLARSLIHEVKLLVRAGVLLDTE